MKVLLLGATGSIGRRVASELARADEVESLTVAGHRSGRPERLAALLRGRATPLTLNILRPGELERAARGFDVCVSCAGPAYLLEVPAIAACIAAGTSYVSLSDDRIAAETLTRLDEDARAADVTVLSGCGLSPGITNLLVTRAAEELDSVDEAEIAVAISSMEADGPASALHFLHQMGSDAPYITDHRPAVERGGSGPRLVYFPEPVGWIETFRSGHPEVATLMGKHPGLRALHYHIGLTEKQSMDVVRGSVALGFARNEQRRRLWLKLTASTRGVFGRLPPRGPNWTAARVDLWGVRDDRTAAVSLGVVDRLANLASVPVALAGVAVGARHAGKPGVHGPEAIFEPRPFLKLLTRRGIRIARLEPTPV